MKSHQTCQLITFHTGDQEYASPASPRHPVLSLMYVHGFENGRVLSGNCWGVERQIYCIVKVHVKLIYLSISPLVSKSFILSYNDN